MRLAELVVLYFVAGGVGLLFERRVGQSRRRAGSSTPSPAALFVVLAFPGFTWRYLLKHRQLS